MTDTVPVRAVVTVFNGAAFVADAIDSILGQRPRPHEVVVVDDGSTDATFEVLQRYRDAIHIVSQANSGQSNARNVGVATAHGDATSTMPYLSFCDADDRWATDRLPRQLAVLEAGDVDIVFGHVSEFLAVIDEDAPPVRAPNERVPGWLAGAMLLRRDTFERVGPFDEALKGGEFLEWCDRARGMGVRVAMLDDVVLYRSIHGHNTSAGASYRHDVLQAMKTMIDRRRNG